MTITLIHHACHQYMMNYFQENVHTV